MKFLPAKKPKSLAIKNPHYEKRLVGWRLVASIILVLVLAALLISRLFYLQVINHHYYSTLSTNNLLDTLPIAPNRGLIYSRNGVLLAKNIPSYTLQVTPEKTLGLKGTLGGLQKILPISADDIKAFYRAKRRSRPYQPVPLLFKLTQQQVATFYVNRYRFPGVTVAASLIRYYPLKNTTAQVLGYVGRINATEMQHLDPDNYSATHYVGKVGIEHYFENKLHGTVGNAEVEINANGKIIRDLQRDPPIPGDNLYLTIDAKLQQVAQSAFPKDDAGAVVAIQPKTGQILAMASVPSFNPNDFVVGLNQKQYSNLLYNPLKPLYNRAIHGLFAPGSTAKPFYSIMGLNSGTITPQYQIFDPGWFRLPGTKHIFHNWKRSGNGWVNVVKAIYVSCDTFFYELAVKLGIHKVDQALTQFGFGTPTGIEMPGEMQGIVPNPAWKLAHKRTPWYTGDTVITGIGQGFLLVTPVQLAAATAALANRGVLMKPTLLLKTQLPNGTFVPNKPQVVRTIKLKNPNTWNVVIHGMEQVIKNIHGTGYHFGRHAPYSVAAKTGTAQVFGHHRDEVNVQTNLPKRLRNNHLFIAFAPIKNPQIAVAVVVEHDDKAASIARKVMDAYFKEQKLKRRNARTSERQAFTPKDVQTLGHSDLRTH